MLMAGLNMLLLCFACSVGLHNKTNVFEHSAQVLRNVRQALLVFSFPEKLVLSCVLLQYAYCIRGGIKSFVTRRKQGFRLDVF